MPIVFEEKVISGTVEGASVTYAKNIPHNHTFAVQLKWSGSTIAGSAKLQGTVNGTDFVDVKNSEFPITANSGNELWAGDNVSYRALRIVCTSTTGAITFEAWLMIKKHSNLH